MLMSPSSGGQKIPPQDQAEENQNYIASALNPESVPDAAMFTIDTAGSTIPYP